MVEPYPTLKSHPQSVWRCRARNIGIIKSSNNQIMNTKYTFQNVNFWKYLISIHQKQIFPSHKNQTQQTSKLEVIESLENMICEYLFIFAEQKALALPKITKSCKFWSWKNLMRINRYIYTHKIKHSLTQVDKTYHDLFILGFNFPPAHTEIHTNCVISPK